MGKGVYFVIREEVFPSQTPKAIPQLLPSYICSGCLAPWLLLWVLGLRERLVSCIILVLERTWLNGHAPLNGALDSCFDTWGAFSAYFCLLMQSPCVRLEIIIIIRILMMVFTLTTLFTRSPLIPDYPVNVTHLSLVIILLLFSCIQQGHQAARE